jgi:hypothetical protein
MKTRYLMLDTHCTHFPSHSCGDYSWCNGFCLKIIQQTGCTLFDVLLFLGLFSNKHRVTTMKGLIRETVQPLLTAEFGGIKLEARIHDGFLMYTATKVWGPAHVFHSMALNNAFDFHAVTKDKEPSGEVIVVGLLNGFKPSGFIKGVRVHQLLERMAEMADVLGFECHVKTGNNWTN